METLGATLKGTKEFVKSVKKYSGNTDTTMKMIQWLKVIPSEQYFPNSVTTLDITSL